MTVRRSPASFVAAAPAPVGDGASAVPERRAVAAVWWDAGTITIIDQRRLPGALVERRLETVADVEDAIRTLAVRGAPAIGITGAYGLVVGLDEEQPETPDQALAILARLEAHIGAVRPTAVNLAGALRRTAAAAERAARQGGVTASRRVKLWRDDQ